MGTRLGLASADNIWCQDLRPLSPEDEEWDKMCTARHILQTCHRIYRDKFCDAILIPQLN